jgi:hypothetical protein
MRSFVIDRFEGDVAVLEAEGGGTQDVPRSKLPEGAAEGDALIFDEESGAFSIDPEGTRLRAERIKNIMDGFFDA